MQILVPVAVAVSLAVIFGNLDMYIKVNRLLDSSVMFQKNFDSINNKFDSVNNKFESINVKFDSINDKFDSINDKFDRMNDKFDRNFGSLVEEREKIAEMKGKVDVVLRDKK